ncbi:MAG: SWIM zinc finger domain-containing protein [Candidatus Scalindua sp.]|nr:SWIM zinc finger domain-containing protein [Candidatus Scalindua sp.]MBT5304891.1 SWIM zinc finger domain-containing protein [Candidatus Scalindua sp.]MBT6226498.1 SWIM zinc finger domain-containing protein [Candidatus Scalindua sp.]MBT6564507.1 SWIM zinc finger domain-containing protein [Candidatus Scalindua sp.]MBT7213026.1 SWIM zinc finger domain-containing protein [Candidatus Scalindua sp.]
MSIKNLKKKLEELTYNDLQDWAGTKILQRGDSYFKSGCVTNLRITPKGLLACVSGTHEYITLVTFEGKGGKKYLSSDCTCPYGTDCKHAVATLLAYCQAIKEKKTVQVAKSNDPDFERIESGNGEYDDEFDEEYDDFETDTFPEKASVKSKKDKENEISNFLDIFTKKSLKELVIKLAHTYPEVRTELLDKARLEGGAVNKIVTSMRKEIDNITSEPAWDSHWSDEGNLADFSRVQTTMSSLYEQEQYDAVIDITKELLRTVDSYISTCDDDGDSAIQISECLETGFRAVEKSTWTNEKKVLFAIDAGLNDEYDTCSGAYVLLDLINDKPTWSKVADELLHRLNNLPIINEGSDNFNLKYRRKHLSNFLISAFENSDRMEEILPLCKREAAITDSWERYVDILIDARKYVEARKAAEEGIQQVGTRYPGIVNSLREKVATLAERSGDYDSIVLLRQEEFLNYPSLKIYNKLIKAAVHTKNRKKTRDWALKYLKTGEADLENAIAAPAKKKGHYFERFPNYSVLIDIAEKEKDVKTVYSWYKKAVSDKEVFFNEYEQVAQAIAKEYPDEALNIWRMLAEKQIALTKPSAYETAVRFLRHARDIYQNTGKNNEWESYLAQLRETNKRKTRFIQSLLGLTNKKLI